MTVPPGVIELLVRRANATATADEFVKWAVDALAAGLDSPALRSLAGLDSSSVFDAMPLFDRAVNELEMDLPVADDGLRRAYLRIIAQRIVDGSIEPLPAVDAIHRDVVGPLQHPQDLMPWCFLAEGNDPRTFGTADDETLARLARELARDTLNDTLHRWQPRLILAFGDDGIIRIYDGEEEAKLQWEPIDVESRVVVFYDTDGTWLKPHFVKPNKTSFFGLILTQGDYELVRASDRPPEIDSIEVALGEAAGLEPNPHFPSIDALRAHLNR